MVVVGAVWRRGGEARAETSRGWLIGSGAGWGRVTGVRRKRVGGGGEVERGGGVERKGEEVRERE